MYLVSINLENGLQSAKNYYEIILFGSKKNTIDGLECLEEVWLAEAKIRQ